MQGRTIADIIGFVTFTETCPPTTDCLSGLSAVGHLTRIHEVVPRWLEGGVGRAHSTAEKRETKAHRADRDLDRVN